MNLTDPGLPKVIRRFPWEVGVAVVASLVIAAVYFGLPEAFGRWGVGTWWGTLLMPQAMYAPVCVAVGVAWRRRMRARKQLAVSDGRCCTACLHDLRGLGESGVCPECGATFDVAADRKAWRKARLLRDGAG